MKLDTENYTKKDTGLEDILILIGTVSVVIAAIAFVGMVIGLILKFICMTAWVSIPLMIAAVCFGVVYFMDENNELEGWYGSEDKFDPSKTEIT